MAADDVAGALGRISVSAPVDGIVEIAGPDEFRLDELIRARLAGDDPREVIARTARATASAALRFVGTTAGGDEAGRAVGRWLKPVRWGGGLGRPSCERRRCEYRIWFRVRRRVAVESAGGLQC
jgi:hypothetical protein